MAEYVVKVLGRSKYQDLENNSLKEEKKKAYLESQKLSKPEKVDLQEIAERLESIHELVFLRKAVVKDNDEKTTAIYGSVSKHDISSLLQSSYDINIPRDSIVGDEKFKAIGTFSVLVKLDHNISVSIPVSIKPLEDPQATENHENKD
ncbi:hypothetical protein BB560_002224 [Smittium megazygosporum]|uniref:Large ribosomal subunit protein bL9 C-terminal domain-containing protein n=1 Tax=Smittium megazygosporum TaxID=133381 RepID=A0A2T9ZFE6_9FUNG|nr:hypothetical protein BB560_002224 [Smittium megazygosporum]